MTAVGVWNIEQVWNKEQVRKGGLLPLAAYNNLV